MFKSWLSMVVWVNIVLNSTVVDSDWRFDNLCSQPTMKMTGQPTIYTNNKWLFNSDNRWIKTHSTRLNWQKTNNLATYLTNQINNQNLIPSTDMIQLTLTLTMTTAEVVKMSVLVNNSLFQDYFNPDNHAQLTCRDNLMGKGKNPHIYMSKA